MNYLNQDDPVLQTDEALRAYAVDALLERSLQCSNLFRLQFDGQRLKRVIGKESFTELMPDFQHGTASGVSKYDVYEGFISEAKKKTLRRILSLTPVGYPERPLNYIRSVRLLDKNRTVLRGGDRNAFILFDLPESERAALMDAYRQQRIPQEVVEQVDVDVEKLEP